MFLSIIYRVDHSQQLRSAMFPDVCLVAEPMDGETETKANEGLGMESFASPEALGHCQLTTASPIVFSMCNEVRNILAILFYQIIADVF